MPEEIIINFALGFGLLILGLMFLYGLFHNSYKRNFSFTIDPDHLFFKDKNELIKESDKLAFWVCSLMSLMTVGNGVLIVYVKNFPNISMIFVFIGFAGSWLIKYSFLFYYKNLPVESIPKFWPSR